MIIRTAAERPVELALARRDGQIVDARNPSSHEPIVTKIPVLIAVGAEPIARVIVPLVGKAHGNATAVERPEFLDEPVVELPIPLAPQKGAHRVTTGQELSSIAPDGVRGVDQRNSSGVARIPPIL